MLLIWMDVTHFLEDKEDITFAETQTELVLLQKMVINLTGK